MLAIDVLRVFLTEKILIKTEESGISQHWKELMSWNMTGFSIYVFSAN